MFNIFYKKPFLYKKINGFSNSKLLQIYKKRILDKKIANIPLSNENTYFKLTQPPPPNRNIERNIEIFIFLSISYFMYIMFYYNKYKYINGR